MSRRRQPGESQQQRTDLGPEGVAALSRPIIDTVVKTRDHAQVVARAVLTLPLDVYHYDKVINDREHEAGSELAKAMHSTQAQRTTCRFAYASVPGLDDEYEQLSDEDREKARKRRAEKAAHAETLIGRDDWPTVEGVARGYWLGRLSSSIVLRRGLARLADGWGIR